MRHATAGAELRALGTAGERAGPEALPLAQRLLSSRHELVHRRKIWPTITPPASAPEVGLAQPHYF